MTEESRTPGLPLTGGAPPTRGADWAVSLPVFSGPMELLLYLIHKNEVDIYDIPVAEIARQYEAYLTQMQAMDLDVASEFVLMAATLLHIKSRMLLPRPPAEDSGDLVAPEDPRTPLVEQLLVFRAFKAAAETLREREFMSMHTHTRPFAAVAGHFEEAPYKLLADLTDLMEAFQRVLGRAKDRARILQRRDTISLEQRIQEILDLLESREAVSFTELFPEDFTRMACVITFIAILELLKRQAIRAYQDQAFADIVLYSALRDLAQEGGPETADASGEEPVQ